MWLKKAIFLPLLHEEFSEAAPKHLHNQGVYALEGLLTGRRHKE